MIIYDDNTWYLFQYQNFKDYWVSINNTRQSDDHVINVYTIYVDRDLEFISHIIHTLFVGEPCFIYVIYVCLRIVVSQNSMLCFCFVFLRLVYIMLPVSLNCPFWLPLRYSLKFICQFLWIVHFDCPFGIL